MARMRSIKPEFFADQDLAEDVPNRDARLLYIGLWGIADEHGRLRGDARYIKGQLFAFDDDLTAETIDGLLDMLSASGRAVRYRVGRAAYLFLPKLAQHQRLEPEKVPSRLPGPEDEGAEPLVTCTSEKFSDESAPHQEPANDLALKHVAGGMLHVAGSTYTPAPLALVPPADAPAVDAEPVADAPVRATKPTRTKQQTEEAFGRFWSVYPRREAKQAALKAWAKLAKDPAVDLEAVIAGAERFRDDGARQRAELRFTAHPASWLNGHRWIDERPANGTTAAAPHGNDLQERGGLMLGPANIANLDRRDRMAAIQAQRDAGQPHAIEGSTR